MLFVLFQNFNLIKCLGFVKTIGRLYIGFVTTSFVLAAFHVMLRSSWTVIVDLHGKRTMPMPRAICWALTNCHRQALHKLILTLVIVWSSYKRTRTGSRTSLLWNWLNRTRLDIYVSVSALYCYFWSKKMFRDRTEAMWDQRDPGSGPVQY